MRYWITALFLLTIVLGCGPELSKEDLGTVVFEDPKVAGSDKPYEMPQLKGAAAPVEEKGREDKEKESAGKELP